MFSDDGQQKIFYLKTSYGYVTTNFNNDPPILFISPYVEEATEWVLDDENGIRHARKDLCWDLWDTKKPKNIYLYKCKNGVNQQWTMKRKNDEFFICSKNYKNICVNHYYSDIFLNEEAFPFTVVQRGKSQQEKYVPATKNAALDLMSCYDKGYEFPQWSLDYFQKYGAELGKQCVVYFSDGDLSNAKKLAIQREPVNIAMERHYDEEKLEALFGWRHGFYGKFFKETGTLAPNIAIYTPSFVMDRNNRPIPLHIFNSIGYAFDSERQPDYKVLKGNDQELYFRYVNVFKKILQCVKDKKFEVIVMSLVGGGVFSDLWDNLLPTIWAPAFDNVFGRKSDVTILFMGPKDLPLKNILGMNISNVGLFPDCIDVVSAKYDIRKCLFVNAWDPWSMAGNGNAMDKSLDGFIGRRSMIALLCWPYTNTHLLNDSSYRKI